MENEKLLNQISTINRALGMIEGVSYGMEQSAGQALADAVQMIDETIKEMLEEGERENERCSNQHSATTHHQYF